jgi:hypothetical protein
MSIDDDITFRSRVLAVYTGKQGCMCGCKGTYRYTALTRGEAGKRRGYEVSDSAARLGPRAVRSICGEGGLDLSSEQGLVELVQLDTAARGRPVSYSRLHGRWEVEGGV